MSNMPLTDIRSFYIAKRRRRNLRRSNLRRSSMLVAFGLIATAIAVWRFAL